MCLAQTFAGWTLRKVVDVSIGSIPIGIYVRIRIITVDDLFDIGIGVGVSIDIDVSVSVNVAIGVTVGSPIRITL